MLTVDGFLRAKTKKEGVGEECVLGTAQADGCHQTKDLWPLKQVKTLDHMSHISSAR